MSFLLFDISFFIITVLCVCIMHKLTISKSIIQVKLSNIDSYFIFEWIVYVDSSVKNECVQQELKTISRYTFKVWEIFILILWKVETPDIVFRLIFFIRRFWAVNYVIASAHHKYYLWSYACLMTSQSICRCSCDVVKLRLRQLIIWQDTKNILKVADRIDPKCWTWVVNC